MAPGGTVWRACTAPGANSNLVKLAISAGALQGSWRRYRAGGRAQRWRRPDLVQKLPCAAREIRHEVVRVQRTYEAGCCRLELAREGAEAPESLFKDPRSSDLHKKWSMEIGLDI
ncbi:hypothetical protein Taro_027891 [Colocasia esculenta]|uniref:Uncharacterized protein n=1 Tax=Colocasia esculenta TaxID=4460 RepID=A0A843VH05_COLES|nr:hypothetical protein [Colocasia esculenta]